MNPENSQSRKAEEVLQKFEKSIRHLSSDACLDKMDAQTLQAIANLVGFAKHAAADTRRLNALEAHPTAGTLMKDGTETKMWCVVANPKLTLREAIDAAYPL